LFYVRVAYTTSYIQSRLTMIMMTSVIGPPIGQFNTLAHPTINALHCANNIFVNNAVLYWYFELYLLKFLLSPEVLGCIEVLNCIITNFCCCVKCWILVKSWIISTRILAVTWSAGLYQNVNYIISKYCCTLWKMRAILNDCIVSVLI